MTDNFPNIKSLKFNLSSINERKPTFIVVDDQKQAHVHETSWIHQHYCHVTMEDVIDESTEFVNGFKRVLFSDMSYGYIEEQTQRLLPFKFNIASDFNEHGYAMVGTNGGVGLINRDMKALCYGCVKQDLDSVLVSYPSRWKNWESGYVESFDYQGRSYFLICEHNLIKINDHYRHKTVARFLNEDGKGICFVPLRGSKSLDQFYKVSIDPYNISDDIKHLAFNEHGFCIFGQFVIFASGYYCTYEEIFQKPEVLQYIAELSENINLGIVQEEGPVQTTLFEDASKKFI